MGGPDSRSAILSHRLTKHHGLGNDFLVLLDLAGDDEVDGELARRWCDRRRGVGADGLIVGSLPAPGEHLGLPPDLVMVLYNADGSRAEMSGNGIRCLAQAELLRQGLPGTTLHILTDAGVRTVDVWQTEDPSVVQASVTMGAIGAGTPPASWAMLQAAEHRPVLHLSLGNPHTVVLTDDAGGVDLEAVGRVIPDVNLEIVEAGPEPDAITMRVHERGVGVTEACGTGACAAAHAAHAWGLVGERVRVHMDGGDVDVVLGDDVTLIGPAQYIAAIEVERA